MKKIKKLSFYICDLISLPVDTFAILVPTLHLLLQVHENHPWKYPWHSFVARFVRTYRLLIRERSEVLIELPAVCAGDEFLHVFCLKSGFTFFLIPFDGLILPRKIYWAEPMRYLLVSFYPTTIVCDSSPDAPICLGTTCIPKRSHLLNSVNQDPWIKIAPLAYLCADILLETKLIWHSLSIWPEFRKTFRRILVVKLARLTKLFPGFRNSHESLKNRWGILWREEFRATYLIRIT